MVAVVEEWEAMVAILLRRQELLLQVLQTVLQYAAAPEHRTAVCVSVVQSPLSAVALLLSFETAMSKWQCIACLCHAWYFCESTFVTNIFPGHYEHADRWQHCAACTIAAWQ